MRQSFAIPLYRQGSANLPSSSRWRRRSVWSCQSEPVDWEYAGVNTFRAGRADDLAMHPTVKPTAMMADAIRDVTKRGAVVLDPFAGSGTTLIAAEKTGRLACAIEYDPHYCDVIVRRWQAYTGKTATLEGGLSFEDIEAERSSATPAGEAS